MANYGECYGFHCLESQWCPFSLERNGRPECIVVFVIVQRECSLLFSRFSALL